MRMATAIRRAGVETRFLKDVRAYDVNVTPFPMMEDGHQRAFFSTSRSQYNL